MSRNRAPLNDLSFLSSERGRWIIYVTCFLLIFTGLDYVYQLLRHSPIEGFIIETLTVVPASMLVDLVFPAIHVVPKGNLLQSLVGNIAVQRGCDGTEGMFLLLAAVIPFSASWRSKLAGAVLGVLLMYVLNLGRLLGLFIALIFDPSLFDTLHHFVLPTLIVVAGGLFVFFWMDASARRIA